MVTPLRESHHHKSHHSSQHEASHSRKSHDSGGLFRPFDSHQIVNGYDRQADKREHEHGSKKDSQVTKITDHHHHHHTHHHHSNKKIDNRDSEARVSTESIKSEHGTHDIPSETKMTSVHRSPVFSSPLNVPTYSMAHLQSTGREQLATSEGMRLATQESQSCVSKLDLDERRKSESRAGDKPFCSDSECESDSEDERQGRALLISSGPPLKLDTSPKKIKLLTELGLTTFSHKKGTSNSWITLESKKETF